MSFGGASDVIDEFNVTGGAGTQTNSGNDFGYGDPNDVSVNDTNDAWFWRMIGLDPPTSSGTGSTTTGTGSTTTGTGSTTTGTGSTTTTPSSGDILSRFLSGRSTASDRGLATLGFGLATLATALRNTPPEVKYPKYVTAPIYNRALTAPLLPPQPPDQTSQSGQNIYNPMVGLPLFFNPNPFQFNPTEAAKRYGPTPDEIAGGYQGYLRGLERIYNSLGTQPEIAMEERKSGGYLDGPGDGMSDDIDAFIEGGQVKQPAKLSQGEFVIPADVVSGLGNGSSKAGAKELYALMERVRAARHGTTKQPPAIDAEKIVGNV